jgi:hypothetical protein
MEPHPVSRFPKCRLCQDEHRLGPCPSFYSQPSRVTQAAPAKREEVKPKVVQVRAPRAKGAAASAINAPAINTEVSHVAIRAHSAGKESGAGARSGNRRDRAAYNEYMRGYMARRRAAGRVS